MSIEEDVEFFEKQLKMLEMTRDAFASGNPLLGMFYVGVMHNYTVVNLEENKRLLGK